MNEHYNFFTEKEVDVLFENEYVYKMIFNFNTIYDPKRKRRIWLVKDEEKMMENIKREIMIKFPKDCLIKGKTIYCKSLDSALYIKLKYYYELKNIEKAVLKNHQEIENNNEEFI